MVDSRAVDGLQELVVRTDRSRTEVDLETVENALCGRLQLSSLSNASRLLPRNSERIRLGMSSKTSAMTAPERKASSGQTAAARYDLWRDVVPDPVNSILSQPAHRLRDESIK